VKKFIVITLFPDMFTTFLTQGVIGRAVQQQRLDVAVINPRDFAYDKHQTVDDRPYGGGPGMLMMVQPLTDAILLAKTQVDVDHKVIYLSPQGQPLNHQGVQSMANDQDLILICGRYEGIDERVIKTLVDEQWSIGDFVLSGGEIPAMAMIDAIARLLPGVLGHADSAVEDSFANGLLDCPHYTRPEVLDGMAVPKVLLSGDHKKIRQWRLKQSLGNTWLHRPELLNNLALTEEQSTLLAEYQQEYRMQQDDS
jgi:tRNA (guanine37-N1)-methyltransferase